MKGFWENAFFVFLHYRGIGVFWPKIPLNLTSEGLKYPQEVRVRPETCSTICGTPVQAILDQKNWPGWQGGSKKVKIWPRMGLAFIYFGPRSLLEAPKWVKDPGNGLKSIIAAPPPFSLILNVIWSPNNVFQVRRRDASLSRWQGARSEANQKVRWSQSGCCSVLQYHWTWTTCINILWSNILLWFFVVQ